MYARRGHFLPLSTTTAVLVILMMVSTIQIQRVHTLGVVLRLPSTRRRIAFAVNCPYTTCSRAAGASPLALVSHQSSSNTDRRRRRRQNQGLYSTPQALFASSSSSFSSAATGTDDSNKSKIRLVLDTAHDTEELGALLCTLLFSEEEEEHPKDGSKAASPSSTSASSTHTAAGSVIFLQGDLGAGKTCLARGFVRAAVQDWDERVTSPTYLLSNVYQTGQNNLE
jgi:hypothetical protein